VVGAAVTTTTRVSTVPPPTMNCGATTADDGSNRGGSWQGKDNGCQDDTLDCGNGRGIFGAMTMTMTMTTTTTTTTTRMRKQMSALV